MKKMVIIAIVGLIATHVCAQDLSKGVNELGLSGNIKLDEPEPIDYQIDLDVKYGRFVRDRLQIGAHVGMAANDLSWTLTVGPFAEYNFNLGNRWPRLQKFVPFVGASIALATAELESPTSWDDADLEVRRGESITKTESSSGIALIGETGLKYFVSDAVALTAGFSFSWSSDDVFGGESDAKNIKLGVRAYF